MINVNDFKPGVTFMYEGKVFSVVEAQHSKSGRGQAHVKTKAKNLNSGATIVLTFTGGDKVEKALIDKVEMQFLFQEGDEFTFMDTKTYEQVTIPLASLQWERYFLKDGSLVQVTMYNDQILGVVLPDKVELRIISVEGAVKGDTSSGAMKKAILETGLEIQVPLFIKEDELIIVATNDGKYSSRA